MSPTLSLRLVGVLLAATCLAAGGPDTAGAQDVAPVERVAGATRVETAVLLAQAGWPRADTVLLASAADFPDGLVGGSMAARVDGPLLLTDPDQLDQVVTNELRRLAPSEVLLLGGSGALGSAVADQVRSAVSGVAVRRIAGPNRYVTAVRAATDRETAPAITGGTVVVATGEVFPDALTGSSLPDGSGGRSTVLLTPRDRLLAPVADALRDLAPDRVVVVGGRGVVSDRVVEAMEEVLADRDADVPVERLEGDTRYATSAAALQDSLGRVDADPRPLIVATGEDFPDVLAAGALAARQGALVALAPRFRLDDAVQGLVRGHADRWSRVTVLGGDRVVDRDVVAELEAALTGAPRPAAALDIHTTPAGFRGVARAIGADQADRMTGVTWHEGCPVGLDDLATVELTHHTFDGRRVEGELVVARSAVAVTFEAFARLHDGGFPIERMVPIEAYGGDDDASIADNNTSAFNCRTVAGTDRWSNHALGLAIDINPVQNPYVTSTEVKPEAGRAYLDRGDVRPGMAVRPGLLVDTFDSFGWGWGGDFTTIKDYHHFSATGG